MSADGKTYSDPSAERLVLGAVLAYPDALRTEWQRIPAAVWWSPRHEVVARAVTELFARDLLAGITDDHERVVTAMTKVSEAATRTEGTDHRRDEMARLVTNIAADGLAVAPVAVPRYIDRLIYLWNLREVQAGATRLLQRLDEYDYADDERPLSEALGDMRGVLDTAEEMAEAGADDDGPMPLAELLSTSKDYRWLVPGLLERRDRWIVTGWEGAGKSELVHQFATCIAGQVHPFTGWPIGGRDDGGPLRVMVVDCENSWDQLGRRLRRQAAIVDRLRDENGLGPFDWTRLTHRIALYPDGLELTKPSDLARLSRAMDVAAPDLVIIGPLYKLTDSDLNDGPASKAVLVALDRLRVRHDCAMIVEHHPGHTLAGAKGTRSIRPAGSSNLMKWPEFGRGLIPEDKQGQDYSRMILAQWRKDRESRVWPRVLVRGGTRLPWTPGEDSYFADADEWALERTWAPAPPDLPPMPTEDYPSVMADR